jgi:hypothetical protein
MSRDEIKVIRKREREQNLKKRLEASETEVLR